MWGDAQSGPTNWLRTMLRLLAESAADIAWNLIVSRFPRKYRHLLRIMFRAVTTLSV
jgi:hypothetical protein